jgi:arylsulfatase A-like enzyme
MPQSPWRLLALVTLAVLGAASAFAAAPQRPNHVYILVDDLGYYDLGCSGATEVRTPRLDGLAARGLRFTDYYAAAPICSPSRAGLLTGRYPRRFGMEAWVQRADSKRGIPTRELTVAELLQANGYATACIGKWHLGFTPELLPRARGFDHYFGLLHNLDSVEAIYFEREGGVPLLRNGTVVKRPADPAELTRVYTDEAIAFMTQQQRAGKPFFLYLPHTMVHEPAAPAAPRRSRCAATNSPPSRRASACPVSRGARACVRDTSRANSCMPWTGFPRSPPSPE